MISFLLVDDHGVVREGVQRLLSAHFDAEIFEAADVESGLVLFQDKRPDVVLLDLNLAGAGGLEMLRRMLAIDAAAKVVIFSMHSEPVYAVRAIKAGARGYVSKSAPVDELIAGIRKVADGGQYIDREVASRIAVSQLTADDPMQQLSLREVEILRLLGQGKSLTAISEALGMAYKTVANTCTNMKAKLGVERTADLIRLAIEMKP